MSCALSNGVQGKDFDSYMEAHLAFADSLVSGIDVDKTSAAIRKWERFAG